jgi:hypothetical protein
VLIETPTFYVQDNSLNIGQWSALPYTSGRAVLTPQNIPGTLQQKQCLLFSYFWPQISQIRTYLERKRTMSIEPTNERKPTLIAASLYSSPLPSPDKPVPATRREDRLRERG